MEELNRGNASASTTESEPTAEAAAPSQSGKGRRVISWLRELLETVLPAILIALFIHLFLAQATRVYGQSMEPNLHTEQRLVVEKLSYRFHGPRRGDIVVLRLEPYLKQTTLGNYAARIVPPLHVFVLGDNRNASNDSRAFGPVPLRNIIGRAWFSYWPLEDIGFVH